MIYWFIKCTLKDDEGETCHTHNWETSVFQMQIQLLEAKRTVLMFEERCEQKTLRTRLENQQQNSTLTWVWETGVY